MYKQFLSAIAATFLFISCGQQPTPDTVDSSAAETDSLSGWYGEEFDVSGAIPAGQLAALSPEELDNEVVIETQIIECCRKKGCWMKVDMGEGKTMRVTFKDYGFFVPLHADGRKAIMRGVAYMDTIDVELLRHFAEDAGQSQEEIEAITEPEYELTFEATGVLIE